MNTKASSPTMLITGATGNIGGELIKRLAERNIPFRAMIRSAKDRYKLADLPGIDIVEGNFDEAASLSRALAGMEKAFLVTNSSEHTQQQQLRFVAEAKRAGIKHLVKLSQLGADPASPVRFLRYHAVVEKAIQETGMDYTFLRPNLFMQGLLGFRDSIVGQNQFFAAIGAAKVSLVDVRDIAAAGAAALTESGHAGKIYTLTGPQALTHTELATELSTALGRTITFTNVTPEAMRGALAQAGFPVWQADGLLEDYAHYSRNEASAITPDVETSTGQSPHSFAEFARDYAQAFS
ncbi:SDR family oxidoreductase [Spirosoma pollinicola]|uniref:NAD(P)-dependent oxidoreductase n=1 Tax=Spirosoma pollinicola TaxID=2057025 RepID=A0A2K8Z889_9BACT|nr:SDR family oxidoreductase [Spirosoma pollinicola]AUD06081.1 NAD(P)-dependent oxidoreductase [Spirosoma pollinicola]